MATTKFEMMLEQFQSDLTENFGINVSEITEPIQLKHAIRDAVASHLNEKGFVTGKGTLDKWVNLTSHEEGPSMDGTFFQFSLSVSICPTHLVPVIGIGGFKPEQFRKRKKNAGATYNRATEIMDTIASRKFMNSMRNGETYKVNSEDTSEGTKHYEYVHWSHEISYKMQGKGLQYRLEKMDELISQFFKACRENNLDWLVDRVEENKHAVS
jgi:hypothetical protein